MPRSYRCCCRLWQRPSFYTPSSWPEALDTINLIRAHKLAEAKYPGTVDEKLSSEVGGHAWMQHRCLDIRIPHLYGFYFSDHRHVTCHTYCLIALVLTMLLVYISSSMPYSPALYRPPSEPTTFYCICNTWICRSWYWPDALQQLGEAPEWPVLIDLLISTRFLVFCWLLQTHTRGKAVLASGSHYLWFTKPLWVSSSDPASFLFRYDRRSGHLVLG